LFWSRFGDGGRKCDFEDEKRGRGRDMKKGEEEERREEGVRA
jgi:hypothetical protein